jgi:heat-inducible transcriptional repressor
MSEPAIPGRLSREDPDLTDRQRQVFDALVRLHGRTARPVSSETLAREGGIRLSPASIRGALAELESLGLLERPHASAGRVPTARGWELYVRVLLVPAPLPAAWVEEIDGVLLHSERDIEHLLNDASRLLSGLTRQLGLARAASLEAEPLSGLELSALDRRRALLVLKLGARTVRTLVLELDTPLEAAELDAVAAVLRERLIGLPLAAVRQRLGGDGALARGGAVRVVARSALQGWRTPVSTPLYRAGVIHIARHPEFADADRLGLLLEAVETGSPLDRLMVACFEGQAMVRVGVDEDHALSGCSLVSYALPGAVWGAIGVLGPLRMDYARALAAVDAVGSRLAERLA